eukprot:TRINITY_DN75123_c0_g1_i1.p1 TRINITY_DN75123_c0_g1~~TRINITY_DN75123_c0_g1_i1.p1  ORF type:complete len:291 (+),score=148.11 TRINITY_DN75123_c0_g1_i1:2-874(+)
MRSLRGENAGLLASLEEARSRLKQMDRLRQDDKGRVMATLDNWKQHYESAEAEQRGQISTLNDRVCELSAELVAYEHVKAGLAAAEEEKATLRQQLEVARVQLENSTVRTREQDGMIESMRAQTEQAAKDREEIITLQNMVSGLRKAMAKHTEDRQVFEDRVKELQVEVTQRTANETALQEALSAANQTIGEEKLRDIEIAGMVAQHRSEMDTSINRERELQRDKEVLRSEVIQLATRAQHLEVANQSNTAQLQRAHEDNERLRRVLQGQQSSEAAVAAARATSLSPRYL